MSNIYTRTFPKIFPWLIRCGETEASELIRFIHALTVSRLYDNGSSYAWTVNFDNDEGGDLWLSAAMADRLVILPSHDSVVEDDFIINMRLRMQRSQETYFHE